MRCEFGACLIAAALLASACDEKKSVETVPQTTAAESATTGAPAQTAAQPAAAVDEPATDNFGSFADSDWCPRAHDDTVKIVEGMKQTMKLAGKEGEDDDEFAPPERARFLELCGKLPLEMQQCLVVGWAARNREACQTSLDGLDPDAKAAYSELMGK